MHQASGIIASLNNLHNEGRKRLIINLALSIQLDICSLQTVSLSFELRVSGETVYFLVFFKYGTVQKIFFQHQFFFAQLNFSNKNSTIYFLKNNIHTCNQEDP